MKKALFIFLVLSISLQSCFHYHAAYKRVDYTENQAHVFPFKFQKALYKTNIHFLNKDYSGMMFFKRMEVDQSLRVVFMSEFGLKFFDFELRDNGDFQVKYILDELNKETLIGVLEQDIKLLFPTSHLEKGKKYYYRRRKQLYMEKYRVEKSRFYYFFDKNTKTVSRIEFSGSVFKKIKIDLSEYREGIPNQIDIKHINLALRLNLKWVK